MADETKKATTDRNEKIEDLSQKPISDRDAQSVKGGMASIKEAKK